MVQLAPGCLSSPAPFIHGLMEVQQSVISGFCIDSSVMGCIA